MGQKGAEKMSQTNGFSASSWSVRQPPNMTLTDQSI